MKKIVSLRKPKEPLSPYDRELAWTLLHRQTANKEERMGDIRWAQTQEYFRDQLIHAQQTEIRIHLCGLLCIWR